jgi:hypothetical protein
MLPFKIYYGQEIESRLRTNPARIATHYQAVGLLSKAYLKAATADVVVNGFRRTSLFRESEFVQEIQNPSGCEETEHVLPGPSGIVQPPASGVISPSSEEASSKPVKHRLTILLKEAGRLDVVPQSC